MTEMLAAGLFLLCLTVSTAFPQGQKLVNDSEVVGPFPDPESIIKVMNMDSSDPGHEQIDGVKIWRFNIKAEGCGSARFNLKHFSTAPGDFVIIYGLDSDGHHIGMERYEGKGWRQEGEVNSRRVWTTQLVLEFHANSTDSQFLLDYVHYADCYQNRPGLPESICGNNDWEDIKCFSISNAYQKTIVEEAPSVFKIRYVENGASYVCTGWKATTNSRFLTNYHCLGSQTVTNTAELDYKYESTYCNSPSSTTQTTYNADQLIMTSGSTSLDFSIFTLKETTSHVRCLTRTDDAPNPTTQYMTIIHHPQGLPKKVSEYSDQDPGGYCRRASSCSYSNDYCYMCDTDGGSSGSPVFFWVKNGRMPVYALHHFGGCPNSGVKMSLVADSAGSNLGSCS